jgi:hypothetical protein
MRAEIPGKLSALPARAYAMYAPELKDNSDEIKLNIEDYSPQDTRNECRIESRAVPCLTWSCAYYTIMI